MASVGNLLGKAVTGFHTAVYRASKGKVFGKMGRTQLVLLTTTGRKSTQPRTSPLAAFPHGDGFVVIASNGGSDRYPAWYHNLTANPSVSLQVADVVTPMTARTATPQERAEIWPRVVAQAKNFAGYEKKTDRVIPVVVLSPR